MEVDEVADGFRHRPADLRVEQIPESHTGTHTHTYIFDTHTYTHTHTQTYTHTHTHTDTATRSVKDASLPCGFSSRSDT